jgi:hypothetical protein
VLDGNVSDFKPTSRRFLDRADFLALTSSAPTSWPDVAPALLAGKPRFAALPPAYESEALNEAILKLFPSAADSPHE